MIAGIDKNELVHLKFTRVETETLLNWHHSKEFEYLGQMYDIVETKELGDSIYYWCWWDKAETALNRQLEQLAEAANGNNPKNTQQQQRLLDFQKTLFHPDAITAYVLVGSLNNIKPTTNFLMAYSLFASAPPSPPPEIRVNKILSNTA